MLQAAIYADRSAIHALVLPARDAATPLTSIADLLRGATRRGRALLRGTADPILSDHLLDDIGLSRADLAALAL